MPQPLKSKPCRFSLKLADNRGTVGVDLWPCCADCCDSAPEVVPCNREACNEQPVCSMQWAYVLSCFIGNEMIYKMAILQGQDKMCGQMKMNEQDLMLLGGIASPTVYRACRALF